MYFFHFQVPTYCAFLATKSQQNAISTFMHFSVIFFAFNSIVSFCMLTHTYYFHFSFLFIAKCHKIVQNPFETINDRKEIFIFRLFWLPFASWLLKIQRLECILVFFPLYRNSDRYASVCVNGLMQENKFLYLCQCPVKNMKMTRTKDQTLYQNIWFIHINCSFLS